ncbi:MAG: hypothetical protein HY716_04990 [Planctomycetes bacterium]|nr:hypothetical protein [Planctomycetota bacterium]
MDAQRSLAFEDEAKALRGFCRRCRCDEDEPSIIAILTAVLLWQDDIETFIANLEKQRAAGAEAAQLLKSIENFQQGKPDAIRVRLAWNRALIEVESSLAERFLETMRKCVGKGRSHTVSLFFEQSLSGYNYFSEHGAKPETKPAVRLAKKEHHELRIEVKGRKVHFLADGAEVYVAEEMDPTPDDLFFSLVDGTAEVVGLAVQKK